MNVRDMALCALLAALLAVCGWISLPFGDIAFTLQTFGVFLALGLLGGKRGTLAIFLYLLLGAAGLPVFSGFRGGFGMLLGATGGYLAGFLFSGLVYWLITALGGEKAQLFAMAAGLLGCYLFGTVWYCIGYAPTPQALGPIIIKCVVPYLLPDACKLALARLLARRLKRFV